MLYFIVMVELVFRISLSFVVLFSIPTLIAYGQSSFYDEKCADQIFDKYMKESEPVFDKYMDNADGIPMHESESGINNYLDKINNLAKNNLEELNPYAEKYLEELENCL